MSYLHHNPAAPPGDAPSVVSGQQGGEAPVADPIESILLPTVTGCLRHLGDDFARRFGEAILVKVLDRLGTEGYTVQKVRGVTADVIRDLLSQGELLEAPDFHSVVH